MAKQEKLIRRFLSKPRDFSLIELKKMLKGFGYREIKTGKTAGSCIAFFHEKRKHIIRLHKPHPTKHLKKYQLDMIEQVLREQEALQ